MIIAKNRQGRLIQANHACKKEIYYCPDCQERLILKQGKRIVSHFAHHKVCQFSTFTEGETLEHVKGKHVLYQMCLDNGLDAHLEKYLPDLQQRPDIFVNYGSRQVAIEFQCSRLSIEVVQHRTKGYQTKGIEVVWILGKNNAKLTRHPYWYSFPTLLCYQLIGDSLYLADEKNRLRVCLKDVLHPRQYEKKMSICHHENNNRLNQVFLRQFYAVGGKIQDVPKVILYQKGMLKGWYHATYELLSFLWYLIDGKKSKGDIIKDFVVLIDKGTLRLCDMPCVNRQEFICYTVNSLMKQLQLMQIVCIKSNGILEKNAKI